MSQKNYNNPKKTPKGAQGFVKTQNMTKKLKTVTENRLFTRAYSRGSRAVSKSLAIYVIRDRRFNDTRYGITVSKNRGGAVVRNRLRRIIRAAYSELYPRLRKGIVVIIVARHSCIGKKSTDLKIELERLFEKTGILVGSNHNKVKSFSDGNKRG